ncbi:hypothetical protein T439DRAFT_382207 [Meredithblackwellia eburnea MCA 4105]
MTRTLFGALATASVVWGHMSIWLPGMYGFDGPKGCQGDDCMSEPVWPIGPSLTSLDQWWFRGTNYTSQAPPDSAAAELPAGGTWTVQITCHKAFTSYGYHPTPNGSALDACPNNPGAYHADYDTQTSFPVKEDMLSGCALGIADVTSPLLANMDNLVIMSVQPKCVQNKIPKDMPTCSGAFCICGWFWLANAGTANFYARHSLSLSVKNGSLSQQDHQFSPQMTAFKCKITQTTSSKRVAAPRDPVNCKNNISRCASGAKKPLYAYNTPTNVVWDGNDNRPGYHAAWSFTTPGAQNDIFEGPANAASSTGSSSVRKTEGSASDTGTQTSSNSEAAAAGQTPSTSTSAGPLGTLSTPSSGAGFKASTSTTVTVIAFCLALLLLVAGLALSLYLRHGSNNRRKYSGADLEDEQRVHLRRSTSRDSSSDSEGR